MSILTDQDAKQLLKLAHKSILHYLDKGTLLDPSREVKERFNNINGVFTTLRKDDELRGCIGYIQGRVPLWRGVIETAVEASTSDPRFFPVRRDEMEQISLELSILTPLEKVDSYKKIVLGRHGVLIKKGYRQGVFLPQVATETGWDLEEFLTHLASGKAGLAPDAWKKKDTELFIFEAHILSEDQ